MLPKSLNYSALEHLLPPRKRTAHKGDFGHVLIIGGNHGYGGAALMAAEAAARTGAGLTTVATRPEHINAFLTRRPELMVKGIESETMLSSLLAKANAIVLGPGLAQDDWAHLVFKLALEHQIQTSVPMIVDADALNLISAGCCDSLVPKLTNWILTPHLGEAARLLSCSVEEVQTDTLAAAKNIQTRYQGVCLLKGSGSLVAYQDQNNLALDRCAHGNPGMASGGMGDVLSGIIGGLLAQGYCVSDSARLGVCIHAKAADLCAEALGERGMLATDLMPYIRELANPK